MIEYKLAKQLKDAGFPWKDGWGCENCGGNKCDDCNFPTLSELIEACGEIVLYPFDGKWYAGKPEEKNLGGRSDMYYDEYPHPIEEGDTPEEAMGKLYIELKK